MTGRKILTNIAGGSAVAAAQLGIAALPSSASFTGCMGVCGACSLGCAPVLFALIAGGVTWAAWKGKKRSVQS